MAALDLAAAFMHSLGNQPPAGQLRFPVDAWVLWVGPCVVIFVTSETTSPAVARWA